MKPNAAICFLLSGLAIYLLNQKTTSFRKSSITFLIMTVLVISMLTLFEHFFNLNLGVDEFLFKDLNSAVNTSAPGSHGF